MTITEDELPEDLDDEWEDEEEDDWDEENNSFVHAKWTTDGAKTLSEAAEMSESYAAHLRSLEEEGWQLTQPIDGGCGQIHRNPDNSP